MSDAARSKPLERFLEQVRIDLGTLPESEACEIIRELRSHVLDRTAGDLNEEGIEAALRKLGTPRDIARLNLELHAADHAFAPSDAGRSAHRLAAAIRRGVSVLAVTAVSVAAYSVAACWLLTALAKPFEPARVGLWRIQDPTGDLSLSLGRHSAASIGQDVLGWWIIPVGFLFALAIGVVTWQLDVRYFRAVRQARSIQRAFVNE